MVACNLSNKIIVDKERSSYWWDCQTFSAGDWLDSFHMSQATFTYLCSELRSTIEKTDTEMRAAVPAEQRVAVALLFCAC